MVYRCNVICTSTYKEKISFMTPGLNIGLIRLRKLFVYMNFSSAKRKSNTSAFCKKILASTQANFPAARHHVLHLLPNRSRSPVQCRVDFLPLQSRRAGGLFIHVLMFFTVTSNLCVCLKPSSWFTRQNTDGICLKIFYKLSGLGKS